MQGYSPEEVAAFHRRRLDDEKLRFRPKIVEALAHGGIRDPSTQRLIVVTPRIGSWRTVMMVDYKVQVPMDDRVMFVTGPHDVYRICGLRGRPWTAFDPAGLMPPRVWDEISTRTERGSLTPLEAAAFMTYWDGINHGWRDTTHGRIIP